VISRLSQWPLRLLSPELAESSDEHGRQAYMCAAVLIAQGVLSVIPMLLSLLSGQLLLAAAFVPFVAATLPAARALQRGQVQRASLWLMGTFFVANLGFNILAGPQNNPGLFVGALIPVLATLTAGRRWGMIWAVLYVIELVVSFSVWSLGWVGSLPLPDPVVLLHVGAALNVLAMTIMTAALDQMKRRALAQLTDSNVALEVARQDAEAASQLKASLLATMSHEIRTSLSGVLGTLSLAMEGELSTDQRRLLQLSRRSAESLLVILNDVLDYSKLEAGRIELEQRPLSPGELVADITALFTPLATDKGIRICHYIDPFVPDTVMGDPIRLRQVVLNLVSNAVKFTETGGVTMNVSVADGTLRFEVSDTGIGISEAACASLFDEFTQADATITQRFGGTGLGLFISRRLVEAMGGTISIESTVGTGSTFITALPLTLPLSVPLSPPLRLVPAPTASLHGLRVLLAEDHEVNALIGTRLLSELGCEVHWVSDGAEAVAAATTGGFDVVLMDVNMPELDGLQATHRLREAGAVVPIIALTASDEDERERCEAAGMNGFLSKPVTRESLYDTLAPHMPSLAIVSACRA
jgi:signal transduction histidine kinase/CheY-like chemotaxis protein